MNRVRSVKRAMACVVCEAQVRASLRRLRAWAWPSLVQALDDPAYLEDWAAYVAARQARAACPHAKVVQA